MDNFPLLMSMTNKRNFFDANRFFLAFLFIFLLVFSSSLPGFASAPASRRNEVVNAVQKASSAVVNISTEQASFKNPNRTFEQFFHDFFENYPLNREYTQTSLGSGVLIRKDGYVLTNQHVIDQADRIKVTLIDGRSYKAELVGSDPAVDLAVLKIPSNGDLPAIPMGTSSDLMIGETVIAIGNPFGLSHSVTTGVVSALHRSIRTESNKIYSDFIQTDALINPGNSGGALLNIQGELIGITTAIYGNAQGIGFAIPIDHAKRIVDDLIAYGRVHRGWIGLRVTDLTQRLRAQLGYDGPGGVVVVDIFDKSPAVAAQIRPGDIIEKADSSNITSALQYYTIVEGTTVDDQMQLSVWSKGKPRVISVVARAFPANMANPILWKLLGLECQINDKNLAAKYKLFTASGAVVLKVRANSTSDHIGIMPGDVILQLGRYAVPNLAELAQAVASIRFNASVVIVVQRGPRGYYLTIPVE